MKTKLKPLSAKYVQTYSDIGMGVLGRDEAVIALKQLIGTIKTKKLLSSVDKIKPGKNPRESLVRFVEWIKDQCGSMYFRANEGKNFIGYTNSDGMKLSILAFALDFLPELTRMDRKLANLALRTCYAFTGYHNIGEVFFGNRLYNDEWIYDGLLDTITSNQRDPSDRSKEEYKGYLETLESYQKDYPNYVRRFMHYAKMSPSVNDTINQIDNFVCDYRLQFVLDSLKEMMSVCHGKTILEYSNEALEMFLDVNEYDKDSEGQWIMEDGWPLTLEDRVMLVWGGENSKENDYVFYEIEQGANSFAGEFGYTEYSRDLPLDEHVSLDILIEQYDEDRQFFKDLEAMYINFDKMRWKIVHGELKNQFKNERQLQSNKRAKNLQTNTLF